MKYTITIEDQQYVIERNEKTIEQINLIEFLQQQALYPKFFWKSRGSDETTLAIGSCIQMHAVPTSIQADSQIRFYGGICFPSEVNHSTLWQHFPPSFFFLPSMEIIQNPSTTRLITYKKTGTSSTPKIQREPEQVPPITTSCKRSDLPIKEDWIPLIEKGLDHIAQGHLIKMVLARMTTWQASSRIDPYALLQTLQARSLNTTLFFLMVQEGDTFLGATPEKLYTRNRRKIHTEALAGTTLRGATQEEDLLYQKTLLHSRKDKTEVHAVENFLTKACEPITSEMSWDQDYRIIQTTKVQHLYKELYGTLKEGVTDTDLLKRLHPTPAVAGLPQKASLSFIQEHESWDRGWYAGSMGWIGQDAADFAVSIRSALISSDKIHVFAGTGIVEGSDPHKEWEELEHKISQFGELFL